MTITYTFFKGEKRVIARKKKTFLIAANEPLK